jgi:uncharacterized damage-inducible protein DinB
MNRLRMVPMVAFALMAASASGQTARNAPAPVPQTPATIASIVDHDVSAIEREMMDAAEAMPADKFSFSPESVTIRGGDFKGVRTFAQQIKHVAAANYFLWSAVTGDALPANLKNGNGPEELKSKAEIVKFLKDSFTQGHKAAAALTIQNMLQTAGTTNASRLHAATYAVAHAYDHYGQMVEYLRMNGIVPPASRLPLN